MMMMSQNARLLSLMQICDVGFPTGGFSHSLGLEAATKSSVVTSKETLKTFVLCSLENTGSFALPFMKEAHQQFLDPAALCDLDILCEACTANHVARRASTRQGCSMLDTSMTVFGDVILQPISDELPHRHHPIIFGVLCASLDIDLYSAMTAYLYTAVKTIMASAVRLDKVGPIQAQTIQMEIQKHIPAVIERNKQRESKDACMVYPHVDIVQNSHDAMFSKLFYS